MRTITTTLLAAFLATGCALDSAADENPLEAIPDLDQTFDPNCELLAGGCDDLPWAGSFLWRGFNHEWGYNHRINRLGDWIKKTQCDANGCDVTAVHSAASGTGDDTLDFTSFNTFVSTDSARFYHKKKTINLSSVEEQWVEGTAEITVQTDEINSVAVLRGFDIVSTGTSADTLDKLTVKITDETYLRAAGEFKFNVFAGVDMDCDTVECPGLTGGGNDAVDYKVVVYVTVIAGPSDTFNHVRGPVVDNHVEWEDYQGGFLGLELFPENEIFRRDFRVNGEEITGIGGGDFPNAALAFRRLTVNLDKQHHLLELDMALLPQQYDAATGTYEYDLRLFFKQWAADMADHASVLFPALHVLEEPGEADFKATAVLLQFASGESTTGSSSGDIYWAGGNQSADTAVAESTTELSGSF